MLNLMAATLRSLITQSFTALAAEAYCNFVPTKSQQDALAAAGRDTLIYFPQTAGGCAMMSALYAAHLQRMTDAPVYVIAGGLVIGQNWVFGDAEPTRDWNSVFAESNPSWDGHCWVMFGKYIADISLFRTAYSQNSPPALSQYVARQFGKGRGLLFCTSADFEKLGLHYKPQYVLTDDQVTALCRGAKLIVEQ